MTKIKPKVLVAMSGGVDSSVAAALLQKAGFDVVGAYMKCWDGKNSIGQCSDTEDVEMARLVAAKLGIPFYTFDFTKEYRKHVFDYFISGYQSGITPNPDVRCNKYIKFGIFLKKALALGFDYIATGHYVRKIPNSKFQIPNNSKFQIPNKSKIQNSKFKIQNDNSKCKIIFRLYRAKDSNKDQSYFLWQLGQEQLRYCLFPIGDYTKPQVRELAKKFGLPNAERKDSQGLCFVGKVELADFLASYIPAKKGKIIDTKGNFLGWHQGAVAFTIGQRHGIRLAGGPYFVVNKDVKNNILLVTKDEKELYKKKVELRDVNWISGKEPKIPLRCSVSIRYRQKPESAILKVTNPNTLTLIFNKSQRAIASGQSAVFWKGRELLGGGIIV